MRAFVALELPAPVRAAAAAMAEPLRALGDVRWVRPEQMHVTLKFLGDIDETAAAAVAAELRAEPWPPLQLAVHGLGQFPARGAPRVVWAGLVGDLERLAAMAARCEAIAETAAVPREDRPFRAHLTLGRCRSPRGGDRLGAAVRERAGLAIGAVFAVPAVALFRSDLDAGGPTYRALERAALPLR